MAGKKQRAVGNSLRQQGIFRNEAITTKSGHILRAHTPERKSHIFHAVVWLPILMTFLLGPKRGSFLYKCYPNNSSYINWKDQKNQKDLFALPPGSSMCLPFLTACISCTSSWSSRLALRKTLLPFWLIWAARKGHLLAVPWLVARDGCPDGSCVPSGVCWDPSAACWTSALAVLSSGGWNGKTEASDLVAQYTRKPLFLLLPQRQALYLLSPHISGASLFLLSSANWTVFSSASLENNVPERS